MDNELNQEVSDNRLMTMFQRYLAKNKPNDKLLKRFRLCGSQQADVGLIKKSTVVMSNGKHSHFIGLARCNNSWACPVCTAKKMAEYGGRIACAIDALSTQYNQYAVMVTFTLPHTKNMSCWESLEILHDTWFKFANSSISKMKRKYKLKDGTEKTYYTDSGRNAFSKMRVELNIKHLVRVFEVTYGEDNGWHPHIHALLWIPKENFNKVVDYEESLNELWWRCAKRVAKKFYTEKHIAEYLYPDYKKATKDGHKSVYISRNKDGKPRIQKSSNYLIDGWSGDLELTGSYKQKTARNGHYTPRQLLVRAYENPNERDKLLKLYAEYARATSGRKRVNFSNTGINDIVKNWKSSHEYIESLKKKYMDKVAAPFKLVTWFTEEQWLAITILDREIYIRAKILELAKLPDGKVRITDELLKYNIDIRNNPEHPDKELLESYHSKLAA